MSSKQQFKEALKGDKKIISELRNEIFKKDEEILHLKNTEKMLRAKLALIALDHKPKKWYQFWK